MLVLGRKVGEKICIGNDIQIVVKEIRGNKVRVGIDAPDSVVVHREEVLNLIKQRMDAKDVS
jgi:carbon storage regulator